jgi:inhibitor of cysteine peptidase
MSRSSVARSVAAGIAAAVLLSGGCSASVVTLSLDDSGKSISVAADTQVDIQLEWAPGTGYGWQVARHDPDVLKLVEERSLKQEPRDRLGGTEVKLFRFLAVGAGETELELHYLRPWEKEKPPMKVFLLHVVVR